MTAQDTCLHHKHARQREHLDPVSESAVMPSKPIEPHSQQDSPGPNTKLNIEEILTDLEHYHPRRKGWTRRHLRDRLRALRGRPAPHENGGLARS